MSGEQPAVDIDGGLGNSANDDLAGVDSQPPKKRKWPWILGAVIVAIGAVYGGTAWAFGDKIPADTRVSGVAVGGMTKADAITALETDLAELSTTPREITLIGSDTTAQLDPASIDLTIDYDATLDDLIGFSLNPVRIWDHFAGGTRINATASADETKLANEIAKLSKDFRQEPQDASLKIVDGVAQVSKSSVGLEVDKQDATSAVLDDWFASQEPIAFTAVETEPTITTDVLQTFADDTVTPLISKPVSVNVKNTLVELTPAQVASVVSVSTEKNVPAIVVDNAGLTKAVLDGADGTLSKAKEASIAIVDNAPTITASSNGETIDQKALVADFEALTQSQSRTIEAKIITEKPKFSTEDAKKMGIKEIVSEIRTPLPYEPRRTQNIAQGSKRVSNKLIKPGEQFNLEKLLGDITAANGYVAAGVINNGVHTDGMGGGLSQLATNTFNVGYRAGMTDVAHQPHTEYISRYPMVLESTIWAGTIHMIWENNTPYGVMVQSFISGDELVTRLWSTKYYDVKIWQGEPYNIVKPSSRTVTSPMCVPQSAGADGFTAKAGRKVSLNGKVVEDSSLTWRYSAVDQITCE